APAIIRDRHHRYPLLGQSLVARFIECASRNNDARPRLRRRKSVIAARYTSRDLQIDNPVADAIASDHVAHDDAKRARGHRHANAQLAKRPFKPFKMAALVDQAAGPDLTDFIDTIAELITAILDMHFGICERQIAAIDVSDAGHWRSDFEYHRSEVKYRNRYIQISDLNTRYLIINQYPALSACDAAPSAPCRRIRRCVKYFPRNV